LSFHDTSARARSSIIIFQWEKNRDEIWKRVWSEDLDERKEEALVRLWKRKERKKREAEGGGREESEGLEEGLGLGLG